MSRSTALDWIDAALATLEQQGLRRRRMWREGPSSARVATAAGPLVNFASNDYLGLANDSRVLEAGCQAARAEGWGAGASPLITGYADSHRRLEQKLAEFEGTETVLLFPSGFSANAGTIAALVDRQDAVFSDELNHASIIDGCRLSGAKILVYPHGDCWELARLLREVPARRRLIVTDSLFSMAGDLAPLAGLVELARLHQAMLMVDEAHATGVFGSSGRGVCEMLGLESHVDIRVGTLSKALGCAGGFVAGSAPLIDWLVNRARPYIFSTAGPPSNSAAAMAALKIVEDEPWRREELLANAAWLSMQLRSQGWNVGQSSSQILPVVVGEARRAVGCSQQLRQAGWWVPAIRPPSVPAGRSLLRISLSYLHSKALLEQFATVMCGLLDSM